VKLAVMDDILKLLIWGVNSPPNPIGPDKLRLDMNDTNSVSIER
jgi:hypothetical protein